MFATLMELGVAAGLFGGLTLAWFAGKFAGRSLRGGAEHPQLSVIQGAILALLGLLLGFCFAGAISRFVERQDIIVREANAITTAHQRAGLLDAPARDAIRRNLRAYAHARLDLFARVTSDESAIQARLRKLHAAASEAAYAAVRHQPQFASAVLPPLDEVSDLLDIRNASDSRHVPALVFGVLLLCSFAGIASIGFGVEWTERRLRLPAAALIFLTGATLWSTLDMEFPRVGFVRISDAPLRHAASQLDEAAP